MAKTQNDKPTDAEAAKAEAAKAEAAKAEAAKAEAAKAEAAKAEETTTKVFSVFCKCPTPLAVNPAEVEADDAAGAVNLFKSLNGIGDTDHEITAEPVDEKPSK